MNVKSELKEHFGVLTKDWLRPSLWKFLVHSWTLCAFASFLHGVFDSDANYTWKMITGHVLGGATFQDLWLQGLWSSTRDRLKRDLASLLEWLTLRLWTRFPDRRHPPAQPRPSGLCQWLSGEPETKPKRKQMVCIKRFSMTFLISSFPFCGISYLWAYPLNLMV